MGTKCAPLVADLFLFCYEGDFMLTLSDNNQADIIEAFNYTSRYLDDLLHIDNPYFEQMVCQIYPTKLVDEDHSKVPTLYWLPKLHKRPYKSRFIASSSSLTSSELSIILTSCLTVIKNHAIKYCETVFERNGKNLFWFVKIHVAFLTN